MAEAKTVHLLAGTQKGAFVFTSNLQRKHSIVPQIYSLILGVV